MTYGFVLSVPRRTSEVLHLMIKTILPNQMYIIHTQQFSHKRIVFG